MPDSTLYVERRKRRKISWITHNNSEMLNKGIVYYSPLTYILHNFHKENP